MISVRPTLRKPAHSGSVWPSTGTPEPSVTGDPFGHRPFSAHASNTDFHRGADLLDGDDTAPVYSPINGNIIRWNYTHAQFDDDENLDQFVETDPNSAAVFSRVGSSLRISSSNGQSVSLPSGMARMAWRTPIQVNPSSTEWVIDLKLAGTIATNGKLCFGVYDPTNNEYAILLYDGANVEARGRKSTGLMGADGTTTAAADQTWLRLRLLASTNTIQWQYGTDGTNWTNAATEANPSWTKSGPYLECFVGWMPDSEASEEFVDIDYFGWFDSTRIGRFGNWVAIAHADGKWLLQHMRHINVAAGDVVRAGQLIGKTGKTGFNITSGRILQYHVHCEYIPNNKHDYSNSEPVNPLACGLLPKPECGVDISVVRSEVNDPDGAASHLLTITVDRDSGQNFQINEFSLTGNSATRTLNWNTRAGLNPSDVDAKSYNGIYFSADAFDEDSDEYVYRLYFAKSAVGTSFVSAYVKDAAGNTIWSE
ncbi:MAG: M23 family metallopeptidase [Planctomycetes bacterium]|nr:M23 family metallopeptidase [Planctomycetota bacterium]